MKKLVAGLILATLAGSAYAAPNYSLQQNSTTQGYQPNYQAENFQLKNNTLKGRVVTVPAGETIKAVVTTPVSSETATAGQSITLVLGSDFFYGGNRIAPAGSTIYGSVIEVSKARHGSMNGKLTLRFTQLITPAGQNVPISAIIKTDDNTGTLVGGTALDVTAGYAKDMAVGAGAGALAGVVISPLAGGSIGRGTALSTAVGAGGGLVKSIWDKGTDVVIPANVGVELILTQPITVSPMSDEDSPFRQ